MAPALIEDATTADVERALARLRDELTAPGQPPSLRTSALTHVAWVPHRWQEAATETLAGLADRHPSRGILLFPRPDDEDDRLDAEVDVRRFVGGPAGRDVAAEVVSVWLRGPRANAPGSVVAPLLVADLPVFLRWRGDLPFAERPLEQLVDIVDRLVVDSREWTAPAASFDRLPELFDRVAVSDIAWSRTEPWRAAVAALWPAVARAGTVRVAGPEPEGLLLAGWLRGRLGRDVELVLEPAGEVELVEVDGVAADPSRVPRRSPSELLSEQLDVFGRDPIYEEAIWSFSSVPA